MHGDVTAAAPLRRPPPLTPVVISRTRATFRGFRPNAAAAAPPGVNFLFYLRLTPTTPRSPPAAAADGNSFAPGPARTACRRRHYNVYGIGTDERFLRGFTMPKSSRRLLLRLFIFFLFSYRINILSFTIFILKLQTSVKK